MAEQRNDQCRQLRFSLLTTGLLVALTGCASSGTSQHTVPLGALALHRSELPQPMQRFQPATPSTLPGSTPKNSIHVEFLQPGYTGMTGADNIIVAFGSIDAARRGFSQEAERMARSTVLGSTSQGTRSGDVSHGYPYSPLALPCIGDQTAGFTADSYGDEFASTTRVIVFRRARYLVFLRVVGLQHQVPVRTAVQLATRIERRIPG